MLFRRKRGKGLVVLLLFSVLILFAVSVIAARVNIGIYKNTTTGKSTIVARVSNPGGSGGDGGDDGIATPPPAVATVSQPVSEGCEPDCPQLTEPEAQSSGPSKRIEQPEKSTQCTNCQVLNAINDLNAGRMAALGFDKAVSDYLDSYGASSCDADCEAYATAHAEAYAAAYVEAVSSYVQGTVEYFNGDFESSQQYYDVAAASLADAGVDMGGYPADEIVDYGGGDEGSGGGNEGGGGGGEGESEGEI